MTQASKKTIGAKLRDIIYENYQMERSILKNGQSIQKIYIEYNFGENNDF